MKDDDRQGLSRRLQELSREEFEKNLATQATLEWRKNVADAVADVPYLGPIVMAITAAVMVITRNATGVIVSSTGAIASFLIGHLLKIWYSETYLLPAEKDAALSSSAVSDIVTLAHELERGKRKAQGVLDRMILNARINSCGDQNVENKYLEKAREALGDYISSRKVPLEKKSPSSLRKTTSHAIAREDVRQQE